MPRRNERKLFILLHGPQKADNGEHDADISRENILSKVSFLKKII
jgi:hypothetical protein